MAGAPEITAFFDEATNSVSYLVADPATRAAAVIDPVLDFDAASGTIATHSVDKILGAAAAQGVTVHWVLETHAHADHLSAANLIRERTGARVAVGAGIGEVQRVFAPILGVDDLKRDDFDRLLEDGDRLPLGKLEIEVIATPGHTPACITYRIGDAAFVGDTMFMPDYGTARCDFPGGDARQLYRSMRRILSLPPETRLFMCHDYKAPGRDAFAWETSVAEQLARNVHIGGGVDEDAYVTMREARDATLKAPKLLYPAIQVNIRGGRLPPPDDQGRRFVTIPLTL
jgi:glyoxylase-like metal-dependent hydrolase (beta-lactamase superfamily II)